MSSIGGILSIAAGALRTHQRAAQVTSHNIANASTPGYSRQSAELAALYPLVTPQGVFGTGVQVVDVARVRDAFLDRAYRQEAGAAGQFRLRHELLARIETAYGEPSEIGLAAGLDAFWAAWSDLAANPAGLAERTVLRERARAVASELNRLAAALGELEAEAVARLEAAVARVNELAAGVAELNRAIVQAEAGGRTAGDLRDERDRLVDELAALAGVQAFEEETGALSVAVSGILLVDGAVHRRLEARGGGPWAVGVEGGSGGAVRVGGRVGALLETLNGALTAQRSGLDTLAAALVEEVNALHRQGTGPAGTTGVEFFDPAGVTAATIRLSAAVAADPGQIAAGTAAADGSYRSGANDIALALAGLRDAPVTTLGRPLGDHFRGLVTGLGAEVARAADAAEVHETLAAQADRRRASLSGVSLDEELVRLMQQQAAFAAAARVVAVADEMLDSLLALR